MRPHRLAAVALVLAGAVALTGCEGGELTVSSVEGVAGCPELPTTVFVPAEGSECDRLSGWGLFVMADGAPPVPSGGVVEYDLRTPLYTDYAAKYRMIWTPDGSSAPYRETGVLELPVGTVIAKTFAYPEDERHPERNVRPIETRLLVHRASGWKPISYLWDEELGDARLEPLGAYREVRWTDARGDSQSFTYTVPNVNQCAECHGFTEGVAGDLTVLPIGPRARYLDRTYPYSDGEQNQLDRLASNGVVSALPKAGDRSPAIAAWDDAEAFDLHDRARAYLEVNCAHCHSETGTASTSGLLLGPAIDDPRLWGVCKTPVRSLAGQPVVTPGRPDRSELLLRMGTPSPRDAMPKLGRTLVHTEAVSLVTEWISWLGTDEATARLGAMPACPDLDDVDGLPGPGQAIGS